MALRNHLGYKIKYITVGSPFTIPGTNSYAHGLDVSKVVYFHWFTRTSTPNAPHTCPQADANISFIAQSPVSVYLDNTNINVVTNASNNTGCDQVTCEIFVED